MKKLDLSLLEYLKQGDLGDLYQLDKYEALLKELIRKIGGYDEALKLVQEYSHANIIKYCQRPKD